MTYETPGARHIRQAVEWAHLTIAAAEEVTLVLSMDPTPAETVGLLFVIAECQLAMDQRHRTELAPPVAEGIRYRHLSQTPFRVRLDPVN